MSTPDKAAAEPSVAATPAAAPAPAPKPADAFAVLLKQYGDIPAGRVVRGAPEEIRALGSTVARSATPQDLGIAGGKSVRLPKKR